MIKDKEAYLPIHFITAQVGEQQERQEQQGLQEQQSA